MDLLVKNKDTCQLEKVTDHLKNWCIEDPMRCVYATGIEDRVIENAVSIVGQSMDFMTVLLKDDICFTTAEQVDEVRLLANNAGELTAWYSGFDVAWDTVSTEEHIATSEFKDVMWGWYFDNYMSAEDIFVMNWPKTAYTLDNLYTEIQMVNGVIDTFMMGFFYAYISAMDVLDSELMWVGSIVDQAFQPVINFFTWLFAPIDYSDDYWTNEYDDSDWFMDEVTDPWYGYDDFDYWY